jgi:tRNA(adenine34) deaminase
VLNNQIISRGHNQRELDNDPTAHAEVVAIREASRVLNSSHLRDVTLFVTLEPCAMCAGAIWLARMARVVFGAWDEKAGACGSVFDVARDPRLNHRPQLRGGVLESECEALLRKFFERRRK